MANRLLEGLVDTISTTFNRNKQVPTMDTDMETTAKDKNTQDATGYVTPYGTSAYEWYRDRVLIQSTRKGIYEEYDQMDTESPELSSALDVYADNATQADSEDEEVITINTEDKRVHEILENTKKVLNLDAEAWSLARTIAKYGESFDEIVIDNKYQFSRLKNLNGRTIERNEDAFGRLEEVAFTQRRLDTDTVIAEFKEWQIVHFRMRKDRTARYGNGILYPIRKVYKQLSMMEDAIVISRLVRSPLRYAYLVDTDGLTPDETLSYLEKVKRLLRKKKTVDPRTGKMKLEHNPMSVEEDIFVGVKQGSRADVKVLQGSSVGDLKDLDYFVNKLFAGIKVAKATLGFEKDVNAKATLTEQAVQFAKTIRRLQHCMQDGYRQIFDLALLLNGIAPSTAEYSIGLPIINAVDELRKWEMEQIKVNIAGMLKTTVNIPDKWIYSELLGLSEEEIDKIMVDKEEEVRYNNDLDNELRQTNPNFETDQAMKQLSMQAMQQDMDIKMMTAKQQAKIKAKEAQHIRMLKMLTDWKLGKEADDYAS